MESLNLKKYIDAEVIDLAKVGYTEAKEDEEIFLYLKQFMKKNYNQEIDDNMAFCLTCILDDILDNYCKNSFLLDLSQKINEKKTSTHKQP